jgi:hypothetical protein
MAAALVTVFHRTLAGRVTAVDLLHEEAAIAVGAAPWEWSLSLRGFSQWPVERVRGAEVADISIVGSIPANKAWAS